MKESFPSINFMVALMLFGIVFGFTLGIAGEKLPTLLPPIPTTPTLWQTLEPDSFLPLVAGHSITATPTPYTGRVQENLFVFEEE